MPIPNNVEKNEFVTILSVDNSEIEQKRNGDDGPRSNFVTVLQVGDRRNGSEQVESSEVVKIYRLPGERLGMGLKFVGGISVNESIDRLFIQSVAPDSPADRTRASFGHLCEGDEIIEIEGEKVRSMTRLSCVSLLRDASVCISVLVSRPEDKVTECAKRTNLPPPPVPPRKTSKLSSKEVKTNERLREERKRLKPPPPVPSPAEQPRPSEAETDVPPEATIYTDLISEEDGRVIDSESDDTGSSVSTVISRAPSSCASINGSINMIQQGMAEFRDSKDLTSSSSSFDLDLVLSPFEELERELAEDENELMFQHPNFMFHSECDLFDSDDSDDVFKCLDEALDSVEEQPIDPPVKFKDDARRIDEVVCEVDGENGEFTCYRRSKKIPEPGNDKLTTVSPPPVPPPRKKSHNPKPEASVEPENDDSLVTGTTDTGPDEDVVLDSPEDVVREEDYDSNAPVVTLDVESSSDDQEVIADDEEEPGPRNVSR